MLRADPYGGALTMIQSLPVGPVVMPLAVSPGRRFLYASLRAEPFAVVSLAIAPRDGTLAPVQTVATLPPGFSGEPWAADIHLTPDGRFLYTSERNSSTIAAFRVTAGTDTDGGRLSLIGHVPTEAQPRGFAVAPDGRWLYAVGQRSNRLSRYAIDANSGELRWIDACAVGINPNWVEAVTLP